MNEPSYYGRPRVYWYSSVGGAMTLPFGWTALDHTRPVNTGHVRNPQAARARQFIAEWDKHLAVVDKAEAITESQIKRIAKDIYRWQNRRRN